MSPRGALRRAFDLLETLCARVMGPGWNPLVQLGALGWFFFWILAVSGVYLYIFFDTGITGTYESIEAISREQWWAGGILRSLHRYASIALLLCSKALAAIRGREFPTPDDIRDIAAPVLRHRLALRAEAELEGATTDAVISDILKTVEVPR